MAPRPYIGRFAPSPTGVLHAGSLVAALASWLDVRAHGGRWLIRIEDLDTPRCVPGAAQEILRQLAACGLHSDEPPLWQSTRHVLYERRLAQLSASGWAYPCGCSRKDIEQAWHGRVATPRFRHAERVYPGTCRDGLHGKAARAVRLRVAESNASPLKPLIVDWHDRLLGPQRQNVTNAVGDFVLRRADGLWAYQFAVVVDDADQHITHIVRGQDLADNTPRQIHLQHCLNLPTPAYLHTPLVLASDGNKLSKQNGALPLDVSEPLAALQAAGSVLGLEVVATRHADWLDHAVAAWRSMVVDQPVIKGLA